MMESLNVFSFIQVRACTSSIVGGRAVTRLRYVRVEKRIPNRRIKNVNLFRVGRIHVESNSFRKPIVAKIAARRERWNMICGEYMYPNIIIGRNKYVIFSFGCFTATKRPIKVSITVKSPRPLSPPKSEMKSERYCCW